MGPLERQLRQSVKAARSGYSLMEILICLMLVGALTSYAAPSLFRMVERNKATNAINWILQAVYITRRSAVDYGAVTTLCPTTDAIHCGGKWHDRLMVFTDHNANRNLDSSDHLIAVIPYPYEGGTLRWRSFQNRQYLQMTPLGFTNYQNGNFVYCPQNGDPRFARQIVINIQGRAKKSYDRNNDGIVDDRYGKSLGC